MSDADLRVFEEARPRLLGLAYRILGSRADAEDAAQVQSAVMGGSTNQLAARFSSGSRLTDTGGKTVAATRIPEREDVFNALSQAHVWWEGCQWEIADMNGGQGAILKKYGRPTLTIRLSSNEAGLISDVFITLNPAKLTRLEPVDIH